MFAKGNYSSHGSAPEPDFTSSAATLQTAVHTEQKPPQTVMSHPFASQKFGPSVPQKKTHLDEMFRMRKDLEEAVKTRDEAIHMRYLMADDILLAQEEIQAKEDELKHVSEELYAWKAEAEKLSSRLREQEAKNHMLQGAEPTSASRTEVDRREEAELMQLRQQAEELTAALAQKDAQLVEMSMDTESQNQLHSQLVEEQRLRHVAEENLKNAKSHYQSRLSEVQQLANTQLEKEKEKGAQAIQTVLNEQMNRMEIGSTSQQQQNEQLIAKYKAEIHDQRLRCDQFRKTSERLTTQIKQANEAKRDLERSNQEMQRQIEDMNLRIAALQPQRRENRVPGSFPDSSSHWSR